VITFKPTEDLGKFPPTGPAYSTVKELIDQLIRAYTWEGHPHNPIWDCCNPMNIP